MTFIWTEERVEELKSLHAAGLSASLIADRMGLESRGAICGKLHRLGLSKLRPQTIARQEKKRGCAPKPKMNGGALIAKIKAREIKRTRANKSEDFESDGLLRTELTDLAPEQYISEPVALLDLKDHHCRWPIEKNGETFYCGEIPRDETVPYCQRHCRVAYKGRPGRLAA